MAQRGAYMGGRTCRMLVLQQIERWCAKVNSAEAAATINTAMALLVDVSGSTNRTISTGEDVPSYSETGSLF